MATDSLVRNSLAVSIASGLSAVVGVVATALIVVTYGFSSDADAYYVAILIPRLLVIVFHGSVPAVFIPALSRTSSSSDGDSCQERLVNNLLNHALLLGVVAYAVLYLLAPWATKAMGTGFDDDTWQVCTRLFRFAAVSIALGFPVEVLAAYLNRRGVFARPSGAEALRTGSIITAIFVLPRRLGIDAAIMGFAFGSVLQFLFLYAVSCSKGLRFEPVLDHRDRALRRVVSELLFPAAGVSIHLTPMLVQRSLASLLFEGAVSAFSVAQQIINVLFTVTLRSVNVASHPLISKSAANRDTAQLNATLARSLKLCALVGGLVFVYTVSLSRDGVAIIAGLNSFTPENAALLCVLLVTLALVLPVNGMIAVLRSPHYAFGKAWIPGLHMALMGLVHICFQIVLFPLLGLMGLALAQVAWTYAAFTTILALLPKDCRPVLRKIRIPVVKLVVIAVVTGLVLYFARGAVSIAWAESTRALRILWLGVGSCALAVLLAAEFMVLLARDYREVFSNKGST